MERKWLARRWIYLICWYSLPIIYGVVGRIILNFIVLWVWGGMFFFSSFIIAIIANHKYEKAFKENEPKKYNEWLNEGYEEFFNIIFKFRIDKLFKSFKQNEMFLREQQKDERLAPYIKHGNEMARFIIFSFIVFALFPFVNFFIVNFLVISFG
jgi:hypothetical protein